MTPLTSMVLAEVAAERQRQDEKFGTETQLRVPDGTGGEPAKWFAFKAKERCDTAFVNGQGTFRDILAEEVAEAFAESDENNLRTELIQVAAVAVKWVEAIDRRRAAP